jgi:hypothetical protein
MRNIIANLLTGIYLMSGAYVSTDLFLTTGAYTAIVVVMGLAVFGAFMVRAVVLHDYPRPLKRVG